MDPPAQPTTHSVVIDLAAISTPARRVLDLYDQILAGSPPGEGELDNALDALRNAPRPAGRMGRAIELVTSGGQGATQQAVLDALDLLRQVEGVQPTAPVKTPSRSRTAAARRNRTRTPPPGQDPLPGLFDRLTPGAPA